MNGMKMNVHFGWRVDLLLSDGQNYLAEMCCGSEEGSYLRLIDCVCTTLGVRVIKKGTKKDLLLSDGHSHGRRLLGRLRQLQLRLLRTHNNLRKTVKLNNFENTTT